MKKFVGTLMVVAVVIFALGSVGVAFAQSPTQTPGTGTVLNGFPLSDGSQVLLATEEWLTPAGRVIWHKGISPDVVVTLANSATPFVPEPGSAMTAAQIQSSQDAQLIKAIDELSQGVSK